MVLERWTEKTTGPWEIEAGSAFARIRVDTWSQLTRQLETNFIDWSEFIFRGQRCISWPLISKFDREYRRALQSLETPDPLSGLTAYDFALRKKNDGVTPFPARDVLLAEHLNRFKAAAVGRRGVSPKELSADEWWALGQHFGLATPLLDWTRSAYVACFFALEDPCPPPSGFRALWAFSHLGYLNILLNQPGSRGKAREELDSIELVEAPIDENNRIISQSGVFTCSPGGEDIACFIGQRLDLSGQYPILYRIEIADKQRDAFLRHLEAMNIHAGSLFPDLIGAAAITNRRFEKETSRPTWEMSPTFLRYLQTDLPVHERTTAADLHPALHESSRGIGKPSKGRR
jgi:hypothetical protein